MHDRFGIDRDRLTKTFGNPCRHAPANGSQLALELADAAYGFELPVTLAESPGNIHAHLAGVMPYFMSMEVVDPFARWPVFATDVRIEAGWAIAGDAPGNGLSVDREALRQATPRAGR